MIFVHQASMMLIVQEPARDWERGGGGVGVGWGAVIGTVGVWSDTAGLMRGYKVETEAC